jgi:tetratricopeptide (TPR) repeat protein
MCNAAYYLVETGATKELAEMVDITTAAFQSTGLIEEDPLAYAHFCNSAALQREMSGDFGAAKELLERARDIRCRELPPGHEDIWVVINNMGNLNLSLGNPAEALKYHLICQETVAREVDVNVQINWCNLGRCYTALGRYSEAMNAFERAEGLVGDSEPRFR